MAALTLFFLAGIFNAIMDVVNFKWGESIFRKSKKLWFASTKRSSSNKWKVDNSGQVIEPRKERFPLSSSLLVFVTDIWHFAQMCMLMSFALAAVLHKFMFGENFEGAVFVIIVITHLIIYRIAFGIGFTIFWKWILRKQT